MQQKQTWRNTSAAAAVQSIWGRQISSSVKLHSCVKLCFPELQSLVTKILFNQPVVRISCSNFWRQSLWLLSANYHHWAWCNRCTAVAALLLRQLLLMQQKQTWRTTSATAAVQSIWGRQISSIVKLHSCHVPSAALNYPSQDCNH